MRKIILILAMLLGMFAFSQEGKQPEPTVTIKTLGQKAIKYSVPVDKLEEELNKLPEDEYIIERWFVDEQVLVQCKVVKKQPKKEPIA